MLSKLLSVVYGAVKWCNDCRNATAHVKHDDGYWTCRACGAYAEDQG